MSPAVPTRDEASGDPWAAMLAACAEIDRLAGELALAISALDHDESARLRVELESGLAQLMIHAEAIPMTRQHDDAIAVANEKRVVTRLLLAIAPMPSPDARHRAEAGDRELWNQEASRWEAALPANASGATRNRRTTRHPPTIPDCPRAFRTVPEAQTTDPAAAALVETRTGEPEDEQ